MSQLGSLWQECGPDRCAQNSHQSRLCFFTHQTFPIFIPLVVPCCPNLDLCSKSVLLTGARKIHIKVVYVFLPIRHFPFSFLWLSLGSKFWSLQQKCDPGRRAQNSHQNRLRFLTHQTFPIFIPLAVPWRPNLGPWCKSAILTGARKIHIKIVYVFLPIRYFPVSFLWPSLGGPT